MGTGRDVLTGDELEMYFVIKPKGFHVLNDKQVPYWTFVVVRRYGCAYLMVSPNKHGIHHNTIVCTDDTVIYGTHEETTTVYVEDPVYTLLSYDKLDVIDIGTFSELKKKGHLKCKKITKWVGD